MRLFFQLLLTAATTLISTGTLQSAPPVAEKIVSGTLLLPVKKVPDFKALVTEIKSNWRMAADSVTIADKTLVLSVPGATVMIAYLDYPVGQADIQAASAISWLWPTAAGEALRHQAQLVVSVIGNTPKTLDLYRIFTRVTAGSLKSTGAIGAYMAGQYLLVPKDFYITAAQNMMNNQTLPLYCWIYFGMVEGKGINGGYTFGLTEFGLTEMEVEGSKQPIADIHAALYDATVFSLTNTSKISDGGTFTTQEDRIIKVKLGESAFLKGQKALKLLY